MEQNLPDQQAGKTSKNLKYAICEIVLVVIGVLIALSINTWNENRKNIILEKDYLKSLKENFSTNLRTFKRYLTMQELKLDMRN